MHVELTHEFSFEAAHRLVGAPPGDRTGRLHGHSFRVAVVAAGPIDEGRGLALAPGTLEAACAPVRQALDHRYLNDLEGLERASAAALAAWVWARLAPALPSLVGVSVFGTCEPRCDYRGRP